MFKKCVLLVLVCLSLVASGCARMPGQGDYVKGDAAPVLTADNQNGLVYFYRVGHLYFGAGASYFVQENWQDIGLIKYHTYFVRKMPAGTHTFTATTETTERLTLDVEAGQDYYVECGLDIGVGVGRPSMRLATAAEFAAIKPELEYIRLTTPQEKDDIKRRAEEAPALLR